VLSCCLPLQALIEKETLTGDEFRAILSEYATIPAENMPENQERASDGVVTSTAIEGGAQ
jgi:hypothetical protein